MRARSDRPAPRSTASPRSNESCGARSSGSCASDEAERGMRVERLGADEDHARDRVGERVGRGRGGDRARAERRDLPVEHGAEAACCLPGKQR